MQDKATLLVFLFVFAAVGCVLAANFALNELRKGNSKIVGWQILFCLSGFIAILLLSSVLYGAASLFPK